jgi:hypothetical protein
MNPRTSPSGGRGRFSFRGSCAAGRHAPQLEHVLRVLVGRVDDLRAAGGEREGEGVVQVRGERGREAHGAAAGERDAVQLEGELLGFVGEIRDAPATRREVAHAPVRDARAAEQERIRAAQDRRRPELHGLIHRAVGEEQHHVAGGSDPEHAHAAARHERAAQADRRSAAVERRAPQLDDRVARAVGGEDDARAARREGEVRAHVAARDHRAAEAYGRAAPVGRRGPQLDDLVVRAIGREHHGPAVGGCVEGEDLAARDERVADLDRRAAAVERGAEELARAGGRGSGEVEHVRTARDGVLLDLAGGGQGLAHAHGGSAAVERRAVEPRRA